jgi:hypothetical protein
MDPRTAATGSPDPDAIEFVRFCYRRRRVGWPELYDEMCAVANRGLFRGLDADDLSAFGIGLCLFDMPALAVLARQVVAEEQARRRPVAVVITAEPETVVAVETAAAMVEADGPTTPSERTFDVPVRLQVAPTPA